MVAVAAIVPLGFSIGVIFFNNGRDDDRDDYGSDDTDAKEDDGVARTVMDIRHLKVDFVLAIPKNCA